MTRKRLGELLLYGVFIFADAEGIWPYSHLLALALFVVGTLGLILYDDGFSSLQVTIIAAITFLAAVVIYMRVPIEPPAPPPSETEVIGTLQPGSEADPPNTCPATSALEAWKVMIGDSAIQFAANTKINLLKVFHCPVISLTRDDKGISVDTDLFDNVGKLVATITNNEFHALSGSRYRVERDNDLSKIIIRNAKNDEVFFAHYMNRRTIKVRGVFGCPGYYHTVQVKDNEPIPGVMLHGSCMNVATGATFGSFFAVDPPRRSN